MLEDLFQRTETIRVIDEIIEYERPFTAKEIGKEIYLPEQTVEVELDRLKQYGLVETITKEKTQHYKIKNDKTQFWDKLKTIDLIISGKYYDLHEKA